MSALFAYGTLAFPEVMEAVLGVVVPSEPARIHGWARYRVGGEQYPGLVACTGVVTTGTLYPCCEPAALSVLDDFEGDLYDRVELLVEPNLRESELANVYVISADRSARLTRESWSPEDYRALHLESFLMQCHEFRRFFIELNS